MNQKVVSMEPDEKFIEVIKVGGMFAALVAWFIRLESNVKTLRRDLDRNEKALEKQEEELTRIEERLMDLLDEMKTMLHETKIEVIKSVAEMRHMNKAVLSVKAEELKKLLD